MLVVGGCSDDEGSGRVRTIAFADIVDAECLYLTGTDGTRASDEVSPSGLFKVTFDGSTEKVVFTDENGKPVDVEVLSFRRLSDSYIYLYLKMHLGYYRYYKHLIIRRSDGAVFEMSFQDFYSSSPIIDAETTVQTDYNDNVYFDNWVGYRCIYKIYTHGNEVYGMQINRDDMIIRFDYEWLVDRRGNVLINESYIRLVSGEFARYSRENYPTYFYAWNDSEGFYYADTERSHWNWDKNNYEASISINYGRPASPTTTFEVIKNFELESQTDPGKLDFIPLVYTDKTVLFEVGGKYRVDIYDKDRIEVHEMEYHPLPDGIRFEYYGQKYPHTEKYLYGKSASEIWRLSVETGVPELLYKYDDEFVIKSMTVRNDIVTFTAFELRRGNDVVAEIYPDKTVKVLESTNGDKIIYFERLN